MFTRRFFVGSVCIAGSLGVSFAGLGSKDAAYVGGTMSNVKEGAEGKLSTAEGAAEFTSKSGTFKIPYNKVSSLEYGQKAGRRIAVAVVVSPLALFSKKRKHYLTVSWIDDGGKQQGAVFELGKDAVRPTLVALEARTGKKVEYESEEARKHAGN